jgi:hypothetical protein
MIHLVKTTCAALLLCIGVASLPPAEVKERATFVHPG